MKTPGRPLPRKFFRGRETTIIARDLLGCILWRRVDQKWLAVRIVETEAYLGANDPASHARNGLRSKRNESMYMEGGHLYVYFTYGMHWCANVVTGEADIAEAVLMRGGEPLVGLEMMRARRDRARNDRELTAGPGRLCQALGIDGALDGASLQGPDVVLTPGSPLHRPAENEIVVTPRIGIDRSGVAHWPLRFYIRSSPWVSGPSKMRN